MSIEFWTTGSAVGPNRIGAVAADMESRGWDGLAMVDSQNLATDPYVFLALAAQTTQSLKLMTSVTNVVTRHAAVTASSALTLQLVSRGRFVLGVGRGDSALAHIGRAPARLPWFEQYLATVRAYVNGRSVGMDVLDMPDHIAPPVDGLDLAHRPEASAIGWAEKVDPVPVEVAATGPKVIAAAARHADRVLFALGADRERIRWGINHAKEAAAAAGRDPDTLGFGAYVNVVCHPDVARAREIGRGSASLFARFSAMHGTVASPASDTQAETFKAVHDAYDMNKHARSDGAQTEVLSAEFLDQFAILGPAERCIERLAELAEDGISKFVISGGPIVSRDEEVQEVTHRFIADVAPAVRSAH